MSSAGVFKAEQLKGRSGQAEWRILADYTAIGGTVQNICSAIDEHVARATAVCLNEYYRGHRS